MSRIAVVGASLLCLTVCVGLVATPALGANKRHNASLNLGILTQLNQIRAAHGLAPLELNVRLSAAADSHSLDMIDKGYFAHNSLDGQSFWKRVESYYPYGAFRFWSVGENLYWSAGAVGAASGLRAWMASPEHRANILSPTWREIGVGSISVTSAPGAFGGRSVTLITTDFGVRR